MPDGENIRYRMEVDAEQLVRGLEEAERKVEDVDRSVSDVGETFRQTGNQGVSSINDINSGLSDMSTTLTGLGTTLTGLVSKFVTFRDISRTLAPVAAGLSPYVTGASRVASGMLATDAFFDTATLTAQGEYGAAASEAGSGVLGLAATGAVFGVGRSIATSGGIGLAKAGGRGAYLGALKGAGIGLVGAGAGANFAYWQAGYMQVAEDQLGYAALQQANDESLADSLTRDDYESIERLQYAKLRTREIAQASPLMFEEVAGIAGSLGRGGVSDLNQRYSIAESISAFPDIGVGTGSSIGTAAALLMNKTGMGVDSAVGFSYNVANKVSPQFLEEAARIAKEYNVDFQEIVNRGASIAQTGGDPIRILRGYEASFSEARKGRITKEQEKQIEDALPQYRKGMRERFLEQSQFSGSFVDYLGSQNEFTDSRIVEEYQRHYDPSARFSFDGSASMLAANETLNFQQAFPRAYEQSELARNAERRFLSNYRGELALKKEVSGRQVSDFLQENRIPTAVADKFEGVTDLAFEAVETYRQYSPRRIMFGPENPGVGPGLIGVMNALMAFGENRLDSALKQRGNEIRVTIDTPEGYEAQIQPGVGE